MICVEMHGMQLKMILEDLSKIAISAAKKAGTFLISKQKEKKKIFSEVGRDIKLEIDRDAELIIRKELIVTDITIMGEEFGGKSIDDSFWVVDPLDGTANYFRGLDQCCISIGLMKDNESVIGVIYNFNSDELYTAVKEKGAYLNGERITVSSINSKNKASLTTGFPASETIDSSFKYLDSLREWKKIRMFGSAALSCAYIASGKCDCYAEKGVYLWDFAAGICLVNEAGGKANYKRISDQTYEVNFTNNLL